MDIGCAGDVIGKCIKPNAFGNALGSSLADANSGVEKSTYQRKPMAAIGGEDLGQWNGATTQDLFSSLPSVNFAENGSSNIWDDDYWDTDSVAEVGLQFRGGPNADGKIPRSVTVDGTRYNMKMDVVDIVPADTKARIKQLESNIAQIELLRTRSATEDFRFQKMAQLHTGMIASLEQEISKPFEMSALNEPIDPTDGMRAGPTAERAIQKFGQSGFVQDKVASSQSAVETPLSSFLNYSGETIWKGELFGPQSLPGNTYGVIDALKGFPSALAAARGAWTSSSTQNGYVFTSAMNGSLQVGRTQSSISVNRTPVPGRPAVQVSYGPTLTPTTLARSAINSGAVKVLGPGLSFGGTVLEYGLYMKAGVQMQESAHKANVRDFVTDATLDLQKGIVSGAAGASAGMYAGAAIGSFIPVPIVGTAVGALIGLGVGYLTSVGIENAYDSAGARDYWKGRR